MASMWPSNPSIYWEKLILVTNLTGNLISKNREISCKTVHLPTAQNLQTFSHNLHKSIILAAQHLVTTGVSEEI
jgi:hypothetical protein